jgi:hypothetical protein
MRFFFYGTLIDPDVRALVLGRHAPRIVEPAGLRGWRCVPVPARTYPMLIADPEGRLSGVLVRGLNAVARERLVRYEDDLYELVEIDVEIGRRGKKRGAFTFVARSGRTASGSRTWDFTDWQRRHKRRFLQRLRRRLAA